MSDRITCGGCTETWTALTACHCSGCHRTYAGVGMFDQHRSQYGERGSCLDPATLINQKTGEPLMFFREGMWRGPEATEEQKQKLRAGRAA